MKFRLSTEVDGAMFSGPSKHSPVALQFVSPRRSELIFRLDEVPGENRFLGRVSADLNCEVEPNPKVSAGFQALAEGRIPDGAPKDSLKNWERFKDDRGILKANMTFPVSGLPQSMQSFVELINRDLHEILRRGIQLMRWRYALDGAHNALGKSKLGVEWSLDGETWQMLPRNTGLRFRLRPQINPAAHVKSELQRLVDLGEDEPIAQQLMREANDVANRNRRSALVIAVAALEVGLKSFFSIQVPAARWVIANMPSPSIKRLLTEYMPTLTPATSNLAQFKAPSTRLIKLVENAVGVRNRVAHATGEDIKFDMLEDILKAVSDLLWLLDYYSGNEWALEHISSQTTDELDLASSTRAM